MSDYILRRILLIIPILFGITVIDFALINLAPGDPITAMIDPAAPIAAGDLDVLREELGLNKPFVIRYGIWLQQVASGNMGYSYVKNVSVISRIQARLGPTLILTGSALLLSIIVGIPLGFISAMKQYSFLDYFLTIVAFLGVSIPNFFVRRSPSLTNP